jgi:hypothetical protein
LLQQTRSIFFRKTPRVPKYFCTKKTKFRFRGIFTENRSPALLQRKKPHRSAAPGVPLLSPSLSPSPHSRTPPTPPPVLTHDSGVSGHIRWPELLSCSFHARRCDSCGCRRARWGRRYGSRSSASDLDGGGAVMDQQQAPAPMVAATAGSKKLEEEDARLRWPPPVLPPIQSPHATANPPHPSPWAAPPLRRRRP